MVTIVYQIKFSDFEYWDNKGPFQTAFDPWIAGKSLSRFRLICSNTALVLNGTIYIQPF